MPHYRVVPAWAPQSPRLTCNRANDTSGSLGTYAVHVPTLRCPLLIICFAIAQVWTRPSRHDPCVKVEIFLLSPGTPPSPPESSANDRRYIAVSEHAEGHDSVCPREPLPWPNCYHDTAVSAHLVVSSIDRRNPTRIILSLKDLDKLALSRRSGCERGTHKLGEVGGLTAGAAGSQRSASGLETGLTQHLKDDESVARSDAVQPTLEGPDMPKGDFKRLETANIAVSVSLDLSLVPCLPQPQLLLEELEHMTRLVIFIFFAMVHR